MGKFLDFEHRNSTGIPVANSNSVLPLATWLVMCHPVQIGAHQGYLFFQISHKTPDQNEEQYDSEQNGKDE